MSVSFKKNIYDFVLLFILFLPGTIKALECPPYHLNCKNYKCIPMSELCNGVTDCEDGSDEQNCDLRCPPYQLNCKNLTCIPLAKLCNGANDCEDGSDERNCERNTCPEFRCNSGRCIVYNWLCDGDVDCSDKLDEHQDICKKHGCKKNTGVCSHLCTDYPTGFRCHCREGFSLDKDEKTCTDVDECKIPGSCSQLCFNLEGSHRCDCLHGYVLEENNNRRCKAREGRTIILAADFREIFKTDFHSSNLHTSVVRGLRSGAVFDYDYVAGTVVYYDEDANAIKSGRMEGRFRTETVVYGVWESKGVAVDWIYGHIYWTNARKDEIEMSDMSGKMRKTLIKEDLDQPHDIVLDPLEGWMYWSDVGVLAKIERSGLDGSHRKVIVSTDIERPSVLTLDFVTRKIYWIDAKTFILSSADFNGENRKVILANSAVFKVPSSIDVFEDWIYWTDWTSGAIYRLNKFTGGERTHIFTGSLPLLDIRIHHPLKQPTGHNYCGDTNGNCSHLCLPTPHINIDSPRYTCACPDGVELSSDNKTCDIQELLNSTTAVNGSLDLAPNVLQNPSVIMHSTTQLEEKSSESFNETGSKQGHGVSLDVGIFAGFLIPASSGVMLLITLVAFLLYKFRSLEKAMRAKLDDPAYSETIENHYVLEENNINHPNNACGVDITMKPMK